MSSSLEILTYRELVPQHMCGGISRGKHRSIAQYYIIHLGISSDLDLGASFINVCAMDERLLSSNTETKTTYA